MKLSYLAPLAFFAAACTANTVVTDPNNSSGGTNPDRGVEGTGVQNPATAPDKSPSGVDYPTANQGVTVGSVIQNYKFLGYPDGNPANGLQPMSMAQFFDPSGSKYKLIHVQASGTWCTYCKQEIRTVIPLAPQLNERKVVWIVSLAEGTVQGTPAAKEDLDKWISSFKWNAPHFLDSGNKNFGPFYDAAALPWNANIDAKTMKILSTGVGAATTEKAILDDLDAQLKKIQ
jgi:thiol-disulfide isomerase/thioredoxin